ncbi:hypothetical protein [Candidatus Odyssella thessalonicensis]|uniref:hypothetical protein n=1 Tax=Candidatus Odyssella thessalonicensis TaxID=84647 RepID=UPI0003031219|nr:hypothetical protein [Candidatus Odyssella thessalonicensis]
MHTILLKTLNFAKSYPRAAAFLLGGLSILYFAPFHFSPVGIISFSGLLYLVNLPIWSDRPYLYGWWFGFGYFVGGLYWIANALKTVGLWYFMPLGWFGLPAFLALFIAPILGLTIKYSHPGVKRCLLFALLWSVAEYARGHVLSGFPWNLNGYTWSLEVLQLTSALGIYGLSLLTTLLFVSFASQTKKFPITCVVFL